MRQPFRKQYPEILFTILSLLISGLASPGLTQHQSDAYHKVLQKADSLRTTGKLKDAEIAYRQALILNKNSAEAFKGLGKIARVEEALFAKAENVIAPCESDSAIGNSQNF